MPVAYAHVPLVLLLCAVAASPAAAQQTRPQTPQTAAPSTASELKAMKRHLATMQKLVNGLRAQLEAEAAARTAMQARLESLSKQLEGANGSVRALQNNSLLDLNGYVNLDLSSGYPTIVFNGVNVQVVNGTGATQNVNGLGNLIVGYNRPRTTAPVCSLGYFGTEAECTSRGGLWARNHKSGSHNVIAGDFNGYSSWGGVVFGLENAVTAPYASVLGGAGNRALGDLSAVGGGSLNTASGMYGSVNGGLSNTASGAFSTVGGGNARTAGAAHDWTAGSLTQDQ